MKTIYLASRYGRRKEMLEHKKWIEAMGFKVNSRWLDGSHQVGLGGKAGEDLVEGDNGVQTPEAIALRGKFAEDDLDDVSDADIFVTFTEPPRSTASRGGRHVEFGWAFAYGCAMIVVGFRENIFHSLSEVTFCEDVAQLKVALEALK